MWDGVGELEYVMYHSIVLDFSALPERADVLSQVPRAKSSVKCANSVKLATDKTAVLCPVPSLNGCKRPTLYRLSFWRRAQITSSLMPNLYFQLLAANPVLAASDT
jgi:hypothetical protein